LKAGTGYDIKYPKRVQFAAIALIKENNLRTTEMD